VHGSGVVVRGRRACDSTRVRSHANIIVAGNDRNDHMSALSERTVRADTGYR
jgi:hypothetical protein